MGMFIVLYSHISIKVTAFRDCANNRQDNELLLLTTFLNDVVALAEDVRKVDLRNWKKRS
jgi:hypothetical protein